jgi:hypothetical protein
MLSDLKETEQGWDIMPRYEHDIKFVAVHPSVGSLTCVGPDHPLAMVEEDSPGSRGTWWWDDDLPSGST